MSTWGENYEAAVLETDPDKLKDKVYAAEGSIFQRLQELTGIPGHPDERARIAEAVERLRRLQVEKLGFPPMP